MMFISKQHIINIGRYNRDLLLLNYWKEKFLQNSDNYLILVYVLIIQNCSNEFRMNSRNGLQVLRILENMKTILKNFNQNYWNY